MCQVMTSRPRAGGLRGWPSDFKHGLGAVNFDLDITRRLDLGHGDGDWNQGRRRWGSKISVRAIDLRFLLSRFR